MAEPQSNFAQYREERRTRRQGSDQESETVKEGGFAQYKAEREAKRGEKRTKTMTRGEVIPLMAREGLEWGTSDESAGVRRAAGLPQWADKAINATPLAPFINMGTGLGAIGAEAAGANMPEAYTEARDEVRGDINQAREEYPVTSFLSELAGGAAYPGGAMKSGAPLIKQIMRMAGIGSVQGGSYAFNAAEGDLGDRLEAGKEGTVFGAALGGALPVGVAGARVPVRSVKNAVAGMYDGLLGLFGKEGGARMSAAEQTAVAAVRRSMERSQMTPQQILDAVREFEGKPAVLAEVIGQDAVNALTSLTRRPGSTPQKAQAIIEDRYGGFVDRAQDDLRKATGLTDDQIAGKFDDDLAARRAEAAPLYEGAFEAFGSISSPRLRQLSESHPLLQGSMRKAQKRLENEAALAGKPAEEMSQLQFWDLVKRDLDQQLGTAQRNGLPEDIRQIEMIRTEVLGQLDAYTGGAGGPYAAAREAGGEAPRMIEARTQGEKAMRPSTNRQTVQDQVNALNPQDRMPYASGVAGKIDEDLAGGRMTPQRIARVPANREKITTALGDDAGGQFVSKMEAEAKLRDTGSRWAPRMNSVTGTVLEGGPSQAVDDAIMMGAAAARGDKVSLITNAVRFMRRRGYNQREIDAMGDLLLSNPMEGLKRLGVRLPAGGNGGAPANVFANGGQNFQQSTSQPVNAFSPVKSAGVAGLRSDAGAAAVGGAVGGFAPAESTEERLRNVFAGAAIATTGGRLDRKAGFSGVTDTDGHFPSQVMVFDPADVQIKGQDGVSSAGFGDKPKTAQQAAKMEIPGSPEWEAARAKGFDMSQAGRMKRAKQMGFDTDTVLYHGTKSDFDAFKVGRPGKLGPGVYFSPDKRWADHYAKVGSLRPDPPRTIEAFVRGRMANIDQYKNAYKRAAREFTKTGYDPSTRANEILREEGFDGVSAIGEVVIFDPSNIRSVNAAFDPDNIASPVLTAGFGGGKLPKLRKDVPTGTPKQAGQSRMSGSIQRGLEESSSMGAAKATGDKAVRQKTAMSEANRMAEAGRNYVDVFDKTGVVLIPYKGGTIKYYAPGADHPDTVIRTFISDLNKPLEKRQPMTNSILSAIGEQEKPLMLGRANTPMIEGTGRTPENVFARKQ